MPIEKGVEWGSAGQLPPDAPVAETDQVLASLVAVHPIVGLGDGDLARTLGIRIPYSRSGNKQLLPVDVLRIELDSGETILGAAHAVVGHLVGRAPFVAIMNAAFIGVRNIAPRAHPGDGLADVVEMSMSPGERLKARQRMVTGAHVPHPSIKIRRRSHGAVDLGRQRAVRVDGRNVGRTSVLRFEVVPSAISIAV